MNAKKSVLLCLLMCSAAFAYAQQPTVGLITKTETNPFFVKMKQGAEAAAKADGAKLMSAAGKFDCDNASRVTAIESMITAGAKAILIAPSDTKGTVPTIKKARDAGVLVIALDTLTDPQQATDALFATINESAAAGAYQALKAIGKEKGVLIVSVDGGCEGVKNVNAGVIAATSQQYPLKMASLGVEAGVDYAKTGKKVSGYTDTGVTQITDNPMSGVAARIRKFGLDN
jgi:ABC-type sugar transport system substrate-binding protein